jgi:hypothetical protein
MNTPKLLNIRKELTHLPQEVLLNICLKLAKHKTENKELLNYLIFYSDDNQEYINDVKNFLDDGFSELPYGDYLATKVLRKVIRLMNKHIKFIGDKTKELEISIYFCELFIKKNIVKTSHKPLIGLLFRQLKRIEKLIPKLDEDLQFDYKEEFDVLIKDLKSRRPSFSMLEIN